jgi:hypothetical protein
MPTVPVYLKEEVYWQVCRYASQWGLGIGKTIALLAEKGLLSLEKEEEAEWRRGNTVRSTTTT